MTFLNTIINGILNMVFPVYCLSCETPGVDLCATCISEFPGAERETTKWIFPLFDYRHPPLKKALWLLKYKGKKRIAKIFAEIMHDKILEELSELSIMENFRNPLLIPIPLSPKRYRERGYNQVELICKELVKINSDTNLRHGVDTDFVLKINILLKIKETEHQAHIKDRRIRLKNLEGSYGVKKIEVLNNRNVILIDDITTTGATLNEARKILKQAGARKVIAFTVAL